MFKIKNVSVFIDKKKIITNINLTVPSGQICALMGPNGSGKSTLAHAIMGHPAYKVMGDIIFDGKSVTELSADKRARLGIFLSFQQPIALPGVTVFTFLYEAYHAINENKHAAKDFTALLKRNVNSKY